MTRRITIAILLTVWAILIAGGVLTYFVTRSVLLADLDDTLMAQVLSWPQVEPPTPTRSVIRTGSGQNLAHATPTQDAVPMAKLVSAGFSRISDDSLQRTITVIAYKRRSSPEEPLVPITIVNSGSAEQFDQILQRLLFTLTGVGIFGGALTAAIAHTVARAALKPMIRTADVFGTINEKSLDRRIEISELPSELQPVGRTLNEMLIRLQSAFSQRQQFLADASHELRTPVAALVTTLEVTLGRARNATEYDRVLQSCLSDAQLLKSLVESLLEQVRSERFSADGASEPVNVSALLTRCADLAETLAAGKDVKVIRKIDPALVVISNESRLRSVIINLLSNAVEYNRPGGTVEIIAGPVTDEPVSLTNGNDSNGASKSGLAQRVRIEVRDTGLGIASEDLKHVFEPFYRADKVRSHDTSHLGLGLFLVKTHIEALGGTIRLESQPGAGTAFRIEIPSANADIHAYAPLPSG